MFIRSIIFYIFLGIWTIFLGIICLPYLLIPTRYLRKPVNFWILGIFKLLQVICNITYEIKGKENIPNRPVIVASKHQSVFETLALFYYIDKSIFIHKRQLFYIPIFGQYLMKTNMISINRSQGASSMRKMLFQAKLKLSNGFSIVIFPEGTRKNQAKNLIIKQGLQVYIKKLNQQFYQLQLIQENVGQNTHLSKTLVIL